MEREFYKVSIPRERVLTRDYWELLQVEPEHRVEFTNKYFYKDVIFTVGSKVKQFSKMLKLKRLGWKLYETVDLSVKYDTVICRLIKVISFAIVVEPSQGSEVVEKPHYSFINEADKGERANETGFPNRSYDHDLPEGILYEDWDKDSTLAGKGGADMDDYNLVNAMLRANDKRVRDRVKGKKVYDEWDLLGKARCSVGMYSFTKRHCAQGVYKDGLCYYHWIQMQDKRSGCNPALPDESLHTMKQPYIPSVDIEAIEAKMKQYYEGSKPVTPAGEEKKYARCKHLLIAGECSICTDNPVATSIDISDMTGLPIGIDIAIKRNLKRGL